MRHPAHQLCALILLGIAVGQVGCSSLRICRPRPLHQVCRLSFSCASPNLAQADSLAAAGDERCVDAYYQVCANSWQSLTEQPNCKTAQTEYNSAVSKLLYAGCRYRRLDPARGLKVCSDEGSFVVPINYQGFTWDITDFERLHPPPTQHESLLTRYYARGGTGLPIVVERTRRSFDQLESRFAPERSYFAATVVLKFNPSVADYSGSPQAADCAELTFYNPSQTSHVRTATCEQPLAYDLTAPLALTLQSVPRTYFAGFIEPGGTTISHRLNFLEPYQPGKIPVVLIHGLFSDPQSWADMINDLRSAPGFLDRYQLWVFRYPTGQGFLRSATALRMELRAAIDALDPEQQDPALRHMVLVGHSMGGLIAKLQVTHSEELLWNELANRPLETIVTTDRTRKIMAENSYFDPSPYVDRVIFIAAPHRGALNSSELMGRGAALLVETSPEQAEMHEQLMRDNPNTFNPLIERRMPTSIDMLSSRSPLLDIMRKMKLKPGIKLHNIIGCANPISLDGPSDGVVSVHSASHPGCLSVIAFNAHHSYVHRSLTASTEVLRILRE
ncbi:esterase/lipase family protein [Anatilimnocola sp. NA78]|uniref:esterase/lipase family protein n=1 Tax=Anatilimnocola sp. NA78 TaxID=3415683 RepID=UPI003CE58577